MGIATHNGDSQRVYPRILCVDDEPNILDSICDTCPPPDLLASSEAALDQYRLKSAEKVLLEQTLKGSVKALSGVQTQMRSEQPPTQRL